MRTPPLAKLLTLAAFLAGQVSFAQPLKDPHNEAEPPGEEFHIRAYLDQVREKHDAFRSAQESREAQRLAAHEARIMWSPSIFATAQRSDDKKPNPTLQFADETITDTYQLGLSQATSIGLSGKLYYNVNELHEKGLNPQLTGLTGSTASSLDYTQASPVLELTMPLWRNWLGGESRNQVEQGEASAEQTFHADSYQMKTVLVQSAMAYWTLALARESVRVAKDAVDRNRQLVKWHSQRAKTGLGDRSDLLQAEAALQSSLIGLKSAQDNANTASRAFNMGRGVSGTDVPEHLMSIKNDVIDRLPMPEKQTVRDDIKAAAEQSRAATAAAEVARQKYLPTLEVYGSLALNNRAPADVNNAYADSFRGDRPTQTIGLRLSAPLDLGLIRDVRAGYARQKLAADLTLRRKQLEEGNDWSDLVDKFNQAKERTLLYGQLEAKQKEKFEYERSRRTAGRTSTQQVLLFETDYEQSQLSRIQALSDLFQVYAQMQLYAEVNDGSR